MARDTLKRLSVALLALACAAWKPATPHERAVELLARLSSAAADAARPATNEIAIQGASGAIRARVYVPGAPLGRTLVVAHGVHHRGIDEPRLVRFAAELSRLGFHVLTPELPDLADYRITRRSLDMLVDSVRYAAASSELPRSPLGLIGISFGGGLSLVAATLPELRQRLAYVGSVGGHHDLGRVLRYFVTSRAETPSGAEDRQAHEYGVAVLAYGALERLSPADDLATLRRVFHHWLAEDRDAARREARALSTAGGRELFALLESGRLNTLAPRLSTWIDEQKPALAALSCSGRLEALAVPAYLLHGTSDRVIPPSEIAWAERELHGRPHAALVTSLIEHVMPDRPAPLVEKLLLVDVIAHFLVAENETLAK